jgi:hypothetical protein
VLAIRFMARARRVERLSSATTQPGAVLSIVRRALLQNRLILKNNRRLFPCPILANSGRIAKRQNRRGRYSK